MSNVQWKPVENALTTPRSHRAQVVPHNTPGYDEMAADISALNPNYNAELVRSRLHALVAENRAIHEEHASRPGCG